MTTSKNQYNPDYRIPPGWILEEHLEARGILPEEFAQQCGRSPQFIHEIIAGEARLDEVTALSFENLLGLAAHIWLGIEDKYQNHRAKQAVDAKIMRSTG